MDKIVKMTIKKAKSNYVDNVNGLVFSIPDIIEPSLKRMIMNSCRMPLGIGHISVIGTK